MLAMVLKWNSKESPSCGVGPARETGRALGILACGMGQWLTFTNEVGEQRQYGGLHAPIWGQIQNKQLKIGVESVCM